MLRYWGEWVTVVLHPFAYVRFCKARAEAERVLAAAIAERMRPVETEREYIYVGPWVKDRGVPMDSLPRC